MTYGRRAGRGQSRPVAVADTQDACRTSTRAGIGPTTVNADRAVPTRAMADAQGAGRTGIGPTAASGNLAVLRYGTPKVGTYCRARAGSWLPICLICAGAASSRGVGYLAVKFDAREKCYMWQFILRFRRVDSRVTGNCFANTRRRRP